MTNGHMTNDEKLAYAKRVVSEFSQEFWNDRSRQLGQMLPFSDPSSLLMDAGRDVPFLEQWLKQGMEPQQWLLIARAGLGLIRLPDDREDAEMLRGEVYESCQSLAEWLFGIPGMSSYHIPAIWAEHPMGQLWHLAIVLVGGDELITIAEAARLAGISTQAVHGRIARGKLPAYIDPNAPAHQGRRLVRRSDIVGES